jgi:hypothetical protein
MESATVGKSGMITVSTESYAPWGTRNDAPPSIPEPERPPVVWLDRGDLCARYDHTDAELEALFERFAGDGPLKFPGCARRPRLLNFGFIQVWRQDAIEDWETDARRCGAERNRLGGVARQCGRARRRSAVYDHRRSAAPAASS